MLDINLGVTHPLSDVNTGVLYASGSISVCSPVSPHERLDSLAVNPGAHAKLALLDLDFRVFAFFVLAASSASRGDF